jgi:hypothetical protein
MPWWQGTHLTWIFAPLNLINYLNSTPSWYAMPCSLVADYRRFEGTYCLLLAYLLRTLVRIAGNIFPQYRTSHPRRLFTVTAIRISRVPSLLTISLEFIPVFRHQLVASTQHYLNRDPSPCRFLEKLILSLLIKQLLAFCQVIPCFFENQTIQ